ncbi:MAG: hypothetical protein ACRC4M_01305 [Mycoplasma sp.]
MKSIIYTKDKIKRNQIQIEVFQLLLKDPKIGTKPSKGIEDIKKLYIKDIIISFFVLRVEPFTKIQL